MVEPGHVVDVFVRDLERVGRCVGGHVDALNAFDAAGLVNAHGRSVADFEQVQVGTATQANRVKTRSPTHGRLGDLARAVVLQVGDVAGRQHNGVVATACKEAVHTAAAGDGVVARRADQGFTARCTRKGARAVQRSRHPLRAAQHHVVAVAHSGASGADQQVVQTVAVDVTCTGRDITHRPFELESVAGCDVAAGVNGH